MFRDEPQAVCMKHTAMPVQIPNEFGHLMTTDALWGMYVEDTEPPNVRAKQDTTARDQL